MMTRPSQQVFNPPGVSSNREAGKWDTDITSLAELASVVTVGLAVPAIRGWVDASTGNEQVWILKSSTSDTADGVQRPNDYAPTNQKVWFRATVVADGGGINFVPMPPSTSSPGAVGDVAVDGDKMAIYVATVGWLFFTGYQQ